MIGYIIFFGLLVFAFFGILYLYTHTLKRTKQSTKPQRPHDLENQQAWPGHGQGQVQQPAHPASAYAQRAVYA